MKQLTKIVITGGPCAGKTAAKQGIKEHFESLGYTVLFVPETATELISGGVAPWTCGTVLEYQIYQMHLQSEKERIFESAVQNMQGGKFLIVCDRGMADNKAYMTKEEFDAALAHFGWSEVEARDSYDAVFHLTTAAKDAPEHYTTDNNSARIETPAQAIELDDKLIAAWMGHPHLRVIRGETCFEDKQNRLLAEIDAFLGEPEPLEIERKFLVAMPDLENLQRTHGAVGVEIEQTYLIDAEGKKSRIRKRGHGGKDMYFHTVKTKISDVKRIEVETRITKDEYDTLLQYADPTRNTIKKTRYCFVHEGHYFELDVFPFWNDKSLMEIELLDENEPFALPPFVTVIEEVTHDKRYRNSALAKKE